MPIPKFQPGDRVQALTTGSNHSGQSQPPQAGQIYTIREYVSLPNLPSTLWVRLVELVNPVYNYPKIPPMEPVWKEDMFIPAPTQQTPQVSQNVWGALGMYAPKPPAPVSPPPPEDDSAPPAHVGPAIHDFKAIANIVRTGRYNV